MSYLFLIPFFQKKLKIEIDLNNILVRYKTNKNGLQQHRIQISIRTLKRSK